MLEEDLLRTLFSHLNMHKSIGPGRMHSKMLREMANATARRLSDLFGRS